MKVLIIEDEIPAARQLERLLSRSNHFDGKVEGPIASISDALDHLKENQDYDLIFMDIHLSDGPSFEIFKAIELKPPIVFCTAYDQYALEAFKQNSIDYLLKPVEPEDLDRALEKYKSLYSKSDSNSISTDTLLKALQKNKEEDGLKKRFLLKLGDRMITKQIDEVNCFFSADKASFLLDENGRSYPLEYSLDQLETMTSRQEFFRINRKYLIRLEAIEDMRSYSGSRIKLKIKGSDDDDILVSRDKTSDFKLWLDQ